MSLDDLDFGSKRRSKKYSYTDEDSNKEERKVKWQRVLDTSEVSLDKESSDPLGEILAFDGDDVEDEAVRGQVGLISDGICASEGLKKGNAHSFPDESESWTDKVDPNCQWRNGLDLMRSSLTFLVM